MTITLSTSGEQDVTHKQQTELASRLKQLREARGMSQQALAITAGLSVSIVARMEQGVKEDPRLSTLLKLGQALDVGVGDLLMTPRPKRKQKRKGK